MSTEAEHAVTVRAARREDLPRVADLAGKLVRLHHALDAQRFFLVEPIEEGYAHFFSEEIGSPEATILVAERPGGAIVGYAYGRIEPRDWNALLDRCGAIHDIFVEESAREDGVATLLMEAIIARLEAMGAPRIVLATAWQNAPAHGLFAKLGFRPTMIEMTRERGGGTAT